MRLLSIGHTIVFTDNLFFGGVLITDKSLKPSSEIDNVLGMGVAVRVKILMLALIFFIFYF